MIEAMQTAIAGLRVNTVRLHVAADSIANMRSSGGRQPYDGFVPKVVTQTTDVTGAPRAKAQPAPIPSFPAYAPHDPAAGTDGMVGMPNVSLPGEFVELSVARRSYEANLAVLRTADEMMRVLVDRQA